jgi:hypothetical protein
MLDAAPPAGLIAKAFEYGIPAFETARLVYGFSYNPSNPRRVPVNSFAHRRTLADHRHRMLTTPNNDTLYSSAVIDLSAGPVALEVPEFGNRYYSIAFLDAYTNNFAYIGTRTAGGGEGRFLIAGPEWSGQAPDGTVLIRAPGHHISAQARILVKGPSEYAQVHRLQDGLILHGPSPLPARPELIAPVSGNAANFIAVLNQVLRADPPPAADTPILQTLVRVGIGADAPELTSEQRAWWEKDFSRTRAELITASKEIGPCDQGWQYLPQATGNFGTDYETRAKIAIRGIAANIAAESIYTMALADRDGRPLDSANRYRLRLAADTPPARAFWSLSIYEMMPDGSMFFSDNELHRYSIGSLTEGLYHDADGGLEILIQKDRPVDGGANWLPAPAKNFALIMRAYLPGPELLDGRFRYPGIEPLSWAGS